MVCSIPLQWAVGIDVSLQTAFHDGLDFVSVHETVVEDLKKALASTRQRQSLEMQVEIVAQKKATNLGSRRAFYNVRSALHSRELVFLTSQTGVQIPCPFTAARQSTVC